MPSTAGSVESLVGSSLAPLLVFEALPQHGAEVSALLQARGYRADLLANAADVRAALAGPEPGALIVVDRDGPQGWAEARDAAAARNVPVLVVVDDPIDPLALVDRLAGVDDWVSLGGLATELPTRVARLLTRRSRGQTTATAPTPPPAAAPALRPSNTAGLELSPQFISLVVHDLRTPLNVIGLSLRMINQAVPHDDPELEEDLRFVDENFRQIERMLTQLSDYYRLYDAENPVSPTEFNPRRLVDELLESRLVKAGSKAGPVSVEVDETCPAEVALDPPRARMALHYAVANATASSGGGPIRVVLRGGPDRWVTEVVIDQPPPASVRATVLTPAGFERLCGFAAERRGMDLAIAARVSELFGGTARLEADAGRTAVVLDWPARLGG